MHDLGTYYAERQLDDVAQFDTLQDTVYHDIVNRMTANSDASSREDVQEMIIAMDSDSAFMCALVELLTIYRHASPRDKLQAVDNLHHAYKLAVEAHAENTRFAEAQKVMESRKDAAFENLRGL